MAKPSHNQLHGHMTVPLSMVQRLLPYNEYASEDTGTQAHLDGNTLDARIREVRVIVRLAVVFLELV